MRILVTATTFPRHLGDTEPAFVYDLCRHLAGLGHDLTVIVPHAPGSAREERLPLRLSPDLNSPPDSGVRVIRFPYWWTEQGQKLCYEGGALPNLRSSWMARANLLPFLWQQWRWFGKILRQESFDLMHVHWILPQGFFAVHRTRKHSIPVVLTAHAGDIFPLKRPGLKWLLRHTVNRSKALTANSQATATELRQTIPGCNPHIIPMGVDLEQFRIDPERSNSIHAKLAPKGPLLLNVGRLASKKGQVYLIQAMSKVIQHHPSAKLVIIGEGPLESMLRREIHVQGLQESIQMLGRVPHEQIQDYYAAADVFLLPSIVSSTGDTEGLGVALLESMAIGTPCIASRVGGITDIIENDQTGILVPGKDPDALANAMIRLLENPEKGVRLAQTARKSIETGYSWPKIARQFETLFQQVLAGSERCDHNKL